MLTLTLRLSVLLDETVGPMDVPPVEHRNEKASLHFRATPL